MAIATGHDSAQKEKKGKKGRTMEKNKKKVEKKKIKKKWDRVKIVGDRMGEDKMQNIFFIFKFYWKKKKKKKGR